MSSPIPVHRTDFNKDIAPVLKTWAPQWAYHGSKGTVTFDLNTLVTIAFKEQRSKAKIDSTIKVLIGDPVGTSELSGNPGAYAFETIDEHDGREPRILILLLTPEEFRRMTLRSLTPNEVQTLLNRYGVFFEIHDDFYDQETGEALQPKGDDE